MSAVDGLIARIAEVNRQITEHRERRTLRAAFPEHALRRDIAALVPRIAAADRSLRRSAAEVAREWVARGGGSPRTREAAPGSTSRDRHSNAHDGHRFADSTAGPGILTEAVESNG